MVRLFYIAIFIFVNTIQLLLANDPSERNNIQPSTYGPNSHRAFLQAVRDGDLPENIRIDLSEITFLDQNGNITNTIDLNNEFRIGTKATLTIRSTYESWEIDEDYAEEIESNTSGSNIGDIDFIGKFVFIDKNIDKKNFKMGGHLILKTTSGDDINNRYTDTMGGAGVLFISGDLIKRDKLRVQGYSNIGFGGLDTHKKSSDEIGGETLQNDLWIFQTAIIISDENLLKKMDVKLSANIVGFVGWFGKESGDQFANCDIELNLSKSKSPLKYFLRYGNDVRGINPNFFGGGVRLDLKSKRKK